MLQVQFIDEENRFLFISFWGFFPTAFSIFDWFANIQEFSITLISYEKCVCFRWRNEARYRCSEILMLFSGVFIVPHHYQRNKLIHHVVELMFLVGCQRKKLSGLYFFVVSINNLFKNAIIWGKFLSDK